MINRREQRRQTLSRAELIESHGIDHIPEAQRRGTPRHQFYVWFAVNMNPITIVVGALAAAAGLGWTTTILVFLVANVAGVTGVGMAAALGPKLGMPQMTAGRATFGISGNRLPSAAASLLFIGYFATTAILGAETVRALWNIPAWPVIVAIGVISVVLTISGYDTVHRMEKWLTWASIAVFAALTGFALTNYPHHADISAATGSRFVPALLLVFGAIFSYAVGWSAYASDYSRYLPSRTAVRQTAVYSALGLFAAMLWMELLGYGIGRLSLGDDVTHGVKVLAPTAMADIVFVTVILICIAGCVMNAYSGVMSAIAWGLPLGRKSATMLFGVAGTVLALVFSGPRFEPALEKFLYLVVYFITPWLSLVLLNWLLRSRRCGGFPGLNVFYDANGELGGVKWPGIVALVVGIGVSVPFMATSLYTGPVGRALDGADISYVISAIVAAAIYFPICGLRPAPGAGQRGAAGVVAAQTSER
ncbi:MAG TPA: cytosine permease [Streptosporangiaceae bacterium]|nr:cytosine permease [Streptosporangiaceae bacterium]